MMKPITSSRPPVAAPPDPLPAPVRDEIERFNQGPSVNAVSLALSPADVARTEVPVAPDPVVATPGPRLLWLPAPRVVRVASRLCVIAALAGLLALDLPLGARVARLERLGARAGPAAVPNVSLEVVPVDRLPAARVLISLSGVGRAGSVPVQLLSLAAPAESETVLLRPQQGRAAASVTLPLVDPASVRPGWPAGSTLVVVATVAGHTVRASGTLPALPDGEAGR